MKISIERFGPVSRSRRLVPVLLAAAACCALAATPASALGQLKKEKEKKPAPAQAPAQNDPNAGRQPGGNTPPPPPPPTESLVGKVLKRDKMKDWNFRMQVLIQAGAERKSVEGVTFKEMPDMQFQSVAIVFPLVENSAASKVLPGADGERMKGTFFFADKEVDTSPSIADGYQSGVKLARWEGRDLKGKDAKLEFELSMECYETTYDEKLAATIPWPQRYPQVAASTLKPQMFVDFMPGDKEKDDRVQKWVDARIKEAGGKDPKSLPPATLAKFLTGRLMEAVQISGDGMIFNSNERGLAGTIMGFDLRGPGATLSEGRGSEHDAACTLAAVFKAAGIAARTVIGYDVFDKKNNEGLGSSSGKAKFRSWVEFCLVDPASVTEIWVPVDLARLRKAGSRARPLDVAWKYFGNNDELAYVIPIAFQYHPPTTVTNQVPALWGWLTNPTSMPYSNTFQFTTFRTPKRGDDMKKDKRDGR